MTAEEGKHRVAALLGTYFDIDPNDRFWVIGFDTVRVVVDVTADRGAPLVRMGALLIEGVAKSPALLEALNEINSDLGAGRVYWAPDGSISIEETLFAETIEGPTLMTFLSLVGRSGDTYANQLYRTFGGSVASA